VLTEYDAFVALLIDPAPLYHRYDKDIPPVADTLRLSVPPVQIVPPTGCVVMDGTAFTVTVAVLLVTELHPLPVEDTMQ
jgi:hypothetical protein